MDQYFRYQNGGMITMNSFLYQLLLLQQQYVAHKYKIVEWTTMFLLMKKHLSNILILDHMLLSNQRLEYHRVF